MSTSHRFDSYLRSTRKRSRALSEAELRGSIEQSFMSCMDAFPASMCVDLYGYFMDSIAPHGSSTDAVIAAAEKLQRVVELFDENYEIAEDELTDAEWETIRQCVDDFALELDTSLITYIMRLILKRGLIG